jgi:FkbM family methyltransferase
MNRDALKTGFRSMIAARRDSRILKYVASGAQRYLAAYNNEWNWNFRYNGEANAVRTITTIVAGEVLDVGANEGQWASMALEVIDDKRLHCFEVVPQTFEKLRANVGQRADVTLNNYGLGSKRGGVEFCFYPDSSDQSSRYGHEMNDGFRKEKISVRIVPGDEYVSQKKIEEIAFLKLDVEGMEMEVLQGFASCLQTGVIKAIQFERGLVHAMTRHLLKDFLDLFGGYSYTVFKMFPKAFVKLDYDVERDESFAGRNFLAVHSQLLERLPNLSRLSTKA